MKKIASTVVVSACTQRVNAIKQYMGAKDEIFVNGEAVKAGQLAQVYQDALDTRATATTAKSALKSAMAGRNAAEAKRLSVDVALEPYVLQRFGPTSTEAQDFGYVPKKVADKTAISKAKATLLNQATRAARGTTGKKAKLQIKGTLSPEAAAALAALSGSTSSAAGTAATPAPAASPAAAPAVASPLVASAAPVATNGAALNVSAHS
jgi:hypothetical protein